MNDDMIGEFPLFANLPGNEAHALIETLEKCEFQPGDVLFEEGSSTTYFYIVMDGEVEIVKSLGTSDERILATSTRGSILGEMSMFSRSGTHTASARARTPLKLMIITFEHFDSLLQRNPRMAYELLRIYSRRLEEGESLTIQDLREKNRQLTIAYQELQAAQAVMIEKEKLEHELQIAAEIQRGILPESLPTYPGLDFGALMIPARQVGGDFYDFIFLDDDHVGIVVGDVCDKGMPAALFMALTYSSVRTEAFRHHSPGNTLRAVNQHLLQINRSNMFVTLLYGVVDCKTFEFTYARAGHPRPMVLDGNNQPVSVPFGAGQLIGIFEDPIIEEANISIPPGGTLFAFSDGLSETVEVIPGSLELPQFCANALEGHNLDAQALCDQLWRMAGGTANQSLIQDDFTLVVARNLNPK